MPIDPTASSAAAAAAARPASAPGATAAAGELGTDTFLKLLVAQLRYQNPLEPSDGTQFLAQTAQFTMVEKLTSLADRTDALLATNRSLAAASFIGRTVSHPMPDGELRTGVVSSVRFGADGPVLVVDGQDVALDAIRDVHQTRTDPETP